MRLFLGRCSSGEAKDVGLPSHACFPETGSTPTNGWFACGSLAKTAEKDPSNSTPVPEVESNTSHHSLGETAATPRFSPLRCDSARCLRPLALLTFVFAFD